MRIIERAQLREAFFRKKVEGSLRQLRKSENPKAVMKSMGSKPKSDTAAMESLRESRSSEIERMLRKICAAKAKKLPNPGNAGGKMSDIGKAGLTAVNHHNGLKSAENSRRSANFIRNIMNSDRSAVSRGALREASMDAAEKLGKVRGAPIVKAASDSYSKNRMITKGNLKTSAAPGQPVDPAAMANKAAKPPAPIVQQAEAAVKTGKLKKLGQIGKTI